MLNNLTFKQFLELSEPKPVTHFKALRGELGIEPEEIAKVPQVASFFNLGNSTYNLSGFKILDYEYDDQGNPVSARITLINDPNIKTRKMFKKKHDKFVQMPDDEPDEKIYMIPIAQLEKLMTQGLEAGAGAGAMGPPGMGGGMGGGLGM